jgi:tetratricopeptide (TPR) repeat protein
MRSLFWLALSLWLASTSVRAQDTSAEPAGYREAVDEAVSELAARNYDEARALFARAHALYPNARTLRGLGFAEFELRNYVACIEQLEQALAANERPLQGALRADTERLLERAQHFVGVYTVDAKPAASRVVVDGAAAELPILRLDPGKHELELYSKSGYTSEKRTLNVRGGERQTLTVLFTQLEAREPRVAQPIERADQGRSWARRPWLWSAVGLAVAGAVVGTVFAVRGSDVETAEPSGGSSGYVFGGKKVER